MVRTPPAALLGLLIFGGPTAPPEPVVLSAFGTQDTLVTYAVLAPRGGTYPGQGTGFRHITRQYLVRQSARWPDRWVWVQWAPDTAMVEIGCAYHFALFRRSADPEPAATTDYDCDV